jgi:ATP-dependent Zn protease
MLAGYEPLGVKWVFSRKRDPTTGKTTLYKARLVVRGFEQISGRDYSELFASVAHKDSIRLLLSLTNYEDLEIDQIDIRGAFLNSDIDRVIYVKPPPGSGIPSDRVLRL